MDLVKNISFFLFFLAPFFSQSQDILQRGGIQFKSYEVPIEERTSLELSKEELFSVKKNINLNFRLAISRHSVFGHLFRIESSDIFFDFVFHPSYPIDANAYLKVILNGSEIALNVPIQKNELGSNRWKDFELSMNFETSTLKLTYAKRKYFKRINADNLKSKRWAVYFGVIEDKKPSITDVAQFSIRDLRLEIDRKDRYQWLMNESVGNVSIDYISGRALYVSNPKWLSPAHFYWDKTCTVETSNSSGVAYDAESHRLKIIDKSKIKNIDLSSLSETNEYFPAPRFKKDAKLRAFSYEGEPFAYDSRHGEIAFFDKQNKVFSAIDSAVFSPLEYQHHNLFLADGRIFTLFGYGYYTFKNQLFEYNKESRLWEPRELKGDSLLPRYLSAVGKLEKDKFLIFGGRGNPKGLQELTVKNYYDLYLLDLGKNKVKKLWTLSPPAESFVPARSLIVDKDNENFYSLAFNPEVENSKLSLYQFRIDTPYYQIVSDSIPYKFRDVSSVSDLYFDSFTRKLIAYTKEEGEDSSVVKVYSLNFPPGLPDVLPVERASIGEDWGALLLLLVWGVGVMLLVAYGIFKMINMVKRASVQEPVSDETEEEPVAFGKSKKNYIQIFGKFQLWNRDGEEISKQLTPKLRQVFLMIFFSQFYFRKGMSSKRLTEIIWPFIPKEKASNSRSIALNRIRTIFKQLDGISIVFENNTWQIDVADPLRCDFIDFCNLKEALSESLLDSNLMKKLISILHAGFSFPEQKNEWLEGKQSFIVSDTVGLLLKYLHENEFQLSPADVIKVVDIILSIDELEDQAFRIKLIQLSKLGNHAKLHSCYKQFTKQYLELYNEEYPLKLEELIGS
ncbi:MAG: hypothetical protein MI784_14905 [Cytophagales bacterium]|nr:hypothetical protein [Cytophagales bacterium]